MKKGKETDKQINKTKQLGDICGISDSKEEILIQIVYFHAIPCLLALNNCFDLKSN